MSQDTGKLSWTNRERVEAMLSLWVEELELCASASDPYPCDAEYIGIYLQASDGLLFQDDLGIWWWNTPTDAQVEILYEREISEHGRQ